MSMGWQVQKTIKHSWRMKRNIHSVLINYYYYLIPLGKKTISRL